MYPKHFCISDIYCICDTEKLKDTSEQVGYCRGENILQKPFHYVVSEN